MWANVVHDTGVHVIPIDDVIGHEYEDCVCLPITEPVPRDDGSMGWLIVHNSLDGRDDDG